MPKQLKKKIYEKTISEFRLQLAEFILLLNKGKTKEEIVELMGLNTIQFESLFNKYYEESESEQRNKTPLRIFAELVGRKNYLIRDLEDLKDFLKKNRYKNAQAYVAAVKQQSDMMSELVKIGQDLGLIVKTPEQVLLVGDRDVREMDADELEGEIVKDISEIQRMLAKRGKNKKKRSAEVISFNSLTEQRESQ